MYRIILQKPADRFLKKLEKTEQRRVIKKLKELRENPYIGVPLVANLSGLWRLRMGDYRVVYQIKNEELIIMVLKIGHRKNAYE